MIETDGKTRIGGMAGELLKELLETPVGGYTPIGDRYICLRLMDDHVRQVGLIYVVGRERFVPGFYLVVHSPKDAEHIPGTIILAGAHIGHPMDIQGQEYTFIPDRDILGVITGGNPPPLNQAEVAQLMHRLKHTPDGSLHLRTLEE